MSRTGHLIDLDDDGRIVLMTKGGEEVLMEDGKGIQLKTPTGQRIFASDDGRVAMTTNMSHAVAASDTEMSIAMFDQTGNSVVIDCTANSVTVKGNMSVNLVTPGVVNISGATVMINSAGSPAAARPPGTDLSIKKDLP